MSVPASITQFLQPSPGTHPVDFQKSGVNASELPQGHFFSLNKNYFLTKKKRRIFFWSVYICIYELKNLRLQLNHGGIMTLLWWLIVILSIQTYT